MPYPLHGFSGFKIFPNDLEEVRVKMEKFAVIILTHKSTVIASKESPKVKIAGIFLENEYGTF